MSEQCQDKDSCKTCQKKTSTVDEQLRVFRSHQGCEVVIGALAVAGLDTEKGDRGIKLEGTGAGLRWGKEERKDRTINILQNLQDQSRTQDGMGKTKTAQDTAPKMKDSASKIKTPKDALQRCKTPKTKVLFY
ncbi:hypothetical protein B0H10DRAFT_1947735 [Mycena sp. CBHHK59/15]|nr:hypothetical protein B0H10DRAFT_1947735 [Mycena sp. CBHHK59/15]